MERTAEIFLDHGRQAIRLPEDIHLSGDRVIVRQDEQTGELILSPRPVPKRWNTWDELFTQLDEIGPAEPEFMEGVHDPILEPEKIF